MITRNLLFIVCAAVLAIRVALAAAAPETIKASYDLFRDGVRVAAIQESFQKTGANYVIVSESTPSELLGLFVRTHLKVQSRGTITAQGLRPDQFNYARVDDARKSVQATFDWSSRQLHMSFDGRKDTAPLEPGTQDRLSILYQFRFLPLDKLKLVALPMTNGRKTEPYRYQVAGTVPVDTPIGRINTLHLVKQRDADDKNTIEVWLARERNLVPVKLLIVEGDGSKFEQVVTRLEAR